MSELIRIVAQARVNRILRELELQTKVPDNCDGDNYPKGEVRNDYLLSNDEDSPQPSK
jgi:hypothetical protein